MAVRSRFLSLAALGCILAVAESASNATITKVTPSTGETNGGTTITVHGTGFRDHFHSGLVTSQPLCRVNDSFTGHSWDGQIVVPATIVSDTEIVCETPAIDFAGPCTIDVAPDGVHWTLTPDYPPSFFTYLNYFSASFDRKPYIDDQDAYLLLRFGASISGQVQVSIMDYDVLTNATVDVPKRPSGEFPARVKVDLSQLPIPFRGNVTVLISDEHNSPVVNRSIILYKLPPSPFAPPPVTLDLEHGTLLVGNEPFFPFGFYLNPDTATFPAMKRMGAMGFNAAVAYCIDSKDPAFRQEIYKAAQQSGVYMLFDIYGLVTQYLQSFDPAILESIKELIIEAREQPSVIAYYVGDDTVGYNKDNFTTIVEFVRALDPYHPLTSSMAAPGMCHEYRQLLDFSLPENYPGPFIGNAYHVTKTTTWYPMDWDVVLTCGQAFAGPPFLPASQKFVSDSMKAQLAVEFLGGAAGQMLFVEENSFGAGAWRYLNDAAKFAAVARDLAPLLLAPRTLMGPVPAPNTTCVSRTPESSLMCRSWVGTDGCVVTLAVNPYIFPIDGQIYFDDAYVPANSTVIVPYESTRTVTSSVADASVTEPFGPYEYRVYTFNCASDPAPPLTQPPVATPRVSRMTHRRLRRRMQHAKSPPIALGTNLVLNPSFAWTEFVGVADQWSAVVVVDANWTAEAGNDDVFATTSLTPLVDDTGSSTYGNNALRVVPGEHHAGILLPIPGAFVPNPSHFNASFTVRSSSTTNDILDLVCYNATVPAPLVTLASHELAPKWTVFDVDGETPNGCQLGFQARGVTEDTEPMVWFLQPQPSVVVTQVKQ